MSDMRPGSWWWQVSARVLTGVCAAFDEPPGQRPSVEVLDTVEYVMAELEPLLRDVLGERRTTTPPPTGPARRIRAVRSA